MCVRGASALADALQQHPGTDAFVVWEPVLPGDKGPPPATVAMVADANVHRYWDEPRALSERLLKSKIKPSCLRSNEQEPVWDAVFVYGRAAPLDEPKFCGRPVLQMKDGVATALTELTGTRPLRCTCP